MPDPEVQYKIKIDKTGTGAADAERDLKRLAGTSGEAEKSLGGLTAGFGKLFAALGGLALINDSVNAFVEAERSVGKLEAALRSTGQYTPELAEEMKNLSGELAGVSSFADEAILNVISKLIALGARKEDVKGLSTAVLDLSTLMDKDLGRATLAMGQALRGNFEMFKQLGITFDETRKPSEQLLQVFQSISKLAGGQASASTKTMGGQFEMMKKQLGELKEAFGGVVLATVGPLDKVIDRLKAMSEWIEKNRAALAFILSHATPTAYANDAWKALSKPKPTNAPPDFAAMGMPAVQSLSDATPRSPFQFLPRPQADALGRTPAIQQADEEWEDKQAAAELKSIAERAKAKLKAEDELEAARDKAEQEQARRSLTEMETARRVANAEIELKHELTLAGLEGAERERAQIEINHERRKSQIREMEFLNEDQYNKLIELEEQLHQKEEQRFESSKTFSAQLGTQLEDVVLEAQHLFASGLAGAIVDSFEQGDQAFKKFAASFLKEIAKMILEAVIFSAVAAGLRALGFAAGSGGQFVGDVNDGGGAANLAASGGQWQAMAGGGMVDSPTFLPKFRVLAGEAGREMLTVLAQPRRVNINGLSAHVGNAGARGSLAVTSASDFAKAANGGGAGGAITLTVNLSPGLEARIVQQSVKGARVQIAQDMQQDSPVSRAAKRLTTGA